MTTSADSRIFLTTVRKFLMIGATGLVATAVYASLFVLLSPEMKSMSAHIVAYLIAVGVQFVILTFRVFAIKGGALAHLRRAGRYVIQVLAILTISAAAEHLIVLPPMMEAGVLVFIITGINAIIYFAWTFRT